MNRNIEVAVPLPIPGALTYSLPPAIKPPEPGTRILVPVGRRNMVGICLGESGPGADENFTIRCAKRVLDPAPLLSKESLAFLKWISAYYFYPLGQTFAEALPPGFLSARDSGIIRILSGKSARGRSRFKTRGWDTEQGMVLTDQQRQALDRIKGCIEKKEYSPLLLHGVTGSGKTEIYLRAAAACLESGRSVLVMVPEIAMTAQITGWFTARFGEMVAVLHSGMTDAQRRDQWWNIRNGKCLLVIGTRSAIFAPVANPGLIIVDEEHDSSYKQTEKLRYNARDMALVLGRNSGATVVLGSATPSVASYWNALGGKYSLITLDRRVAGRKLPDITVVDRRCGKAGSDRTRSKKCNRGRWLTDELEQAIRQTLQRREQVLLFLNRRGFATYVFCPDCGYVFRCDNCDVTMTWHRSISPRGGAGKSGADPAGILRCHYCAAEKKALPVCPQCNGHAVKALGFGTEKIEKELREKFPGIITARIDRDTISSATRLEKIVRGFRQGDIDLVIGTQMITKGHDFPGLTLVGIIWADMSLNVPEFNAAEKTFQLITQVAGRAGRGKIPGRVIVQTWMADHYALQAAFRQDYRMFYRHEEALRKQLMYSPFSRMINLKLSGTRKDQVMKAGRRIADFAIGMQATNKKGLGEGVDILGPAPSPRARIKNRYRCQVLLKSQNISVLRALCRAVIDKAGELVPSSVRLETDVDPESMT